MVLFQVEVMDDFGNMTDAINVTVNYKIMLTEFRLNPTYNLFYVHLSRYPFLYHRLINFLGH